MDLEEELIPSVSFWICLDLGSLDVGTDPSSLVFFQNGLNALHLAAKEGHVDLVQELLDRGAAVDSATKVGYLTEQTSLPEKNKLETPCGEAVHKVHNHFYFIQTFL